MSGYLADTSGYSGYLANELSLGNTPSLPLL